MVRNIRFGYKERKTGTNWVSNSRQVIYLGENRDGQRTVVKRGWKNENRDDSLGMMQSGVSSSTAQAGLGLLWSKASRGTQQIALGWAPQLG